jgi:hypothetical protein
MTEDLTFIAIQLGNLASDVRTIRDELRGFREEMFLLRDELRLATGIINRLADLIIEDKVQDLESKESKCGGVEHRREISLGEISELTRNLWKEPMK